MQPIKQTLIGAAFGVALFSDSGNVYTLQGDYPQGVTLADVGKTMADFK